MIQNNPKVSVTPSKNKHLRLRGTLSNRYHSADRNAKNSHAATGFGIDAIIPTLLQAFYHPYFCLIFRIFGITIIKKTTLEKVSINFNSTILVRRKRYVSGFLTVEFFIKITPGDSAANDYKTFV